LMVAGCELGVMELKGRVGGINPLL